MRRYLYYSFLLLVAGLIFAACGQGEVEPAQPGTSPSVTSTPEPEEAAPTPSGPQPLQELSLERAFAGTTFQRPTNLVQPDDGLDRILVTEQEGLIIAFPNDQETASTQVFLDITDRVTQAGNEEGLLGLAFDPNYQDNGYFYVYYSALGSHLSVISRFSLDSNGTGRADPDTELVILQIPQPFTNHNGGQLAFGPDGYLYIGLGDGGGGGDPRGHGQNTETLLGAILRIDVSESTTDNPYQVPPDNPFLGVDGFRDEIWAYGLRNPWRFSFDPVNGSLWAADVGQDKWEEIDLIERGMNYGWNIMEAESCFSPSSGCDESGLALPVMSYSHDEGCSITGGYVYRGSALPSLQGAYVYGDFCSGKIWGLRYDGHSVTEHKLLVDSDLRITSFGVDLAGNLYVLSLNDGIHILVPAE